VNLVAITKDIVALLDRHKVPVESRLSVLIGIPVEVLKIGGMKDADVRKFIESSVASALAEASSVIASAGKAGQPGPAPKPAVKPAAAAPKPAGIPARPPGKPR